MLLLEEPISDHIFMCSLHQF